MAKANLDQRILRAMRTRGHTPALERAAMLLGKAGNNGAGWFAANAALAAADARRRRSWAACALLGPAAIGLNYGVKLVARRPRPVLKGLPPLGGAPSGLSFPSAHSTSSFAVAVAMTRVDRRAAVAFVPAAAMAAGRPYLGMHYPSDVAVGVVLGVALGALVPLPAPKDVPLPPIAGSAPSPGGPAPTTAAAVPTDHPGVTAVPAESVPPADATPRPPADEAPLPGHEVER